MSDVVKRTTAEAAKALGISVRVFRARAKAAGLEPVEIEKTGKRGRPSKVWTGTQVQTCKKRR